jgi:hypothetical protein
MDTTNTVNEKDEKAKEEKNEPKNYLQNLKNLAPMQIFSIISMLLIALTLPVTVFMALSPIRPIITPATGPVTPPDNPPSVGHAPVIITTQLEPASLGKQYRQVVEGYDLDTEDELNFQVEGLPTEFTLDQCHSNVRKVNGISDDKINYISCSISGKTEKFGDYSVQLTLLDGFNYAQKTLNLKVQ